MKRLTLLLLFIPLIFSACKKEGCRDANALNFDAEASKDGSCDFTKIIFYAGTDKIGGNATKITKIEIYQLIVSNQELVGTIDNIEKLNPVPENCTPTENSVVYQFSSGDDKPVLSTRYYYEDGTDEAGSSYNFTPDKSTVCIVENLTL